VIGGWLAVRGRSGAAQQAAYYLGPGDPCYDDAQCRGADTELICFDNGFDYDGPLNCCAYDGGRCGFDEGCCGGLSCLSGICAAGQYIGSPGGNQGLNQTGSGLSPGAACLDDYQCDNSFPELGIAYCADTGYIYGAYGGTRHCCRYEGGSCGGPLSDDHSLCCGGLLCLNGVCGAAPTGGDQGLNQTGSGFSPGAACLDDYQCDNSFPELGIAYCADNGYVYGAYGGTQHCCRYEGGSCGGPRSDDHSLCCGGLLCLSGQCGWG
jgi:hypothetical protein